MTSFDSEGLLPNVFLCPFPLYNRAWLYGAYVPESNERCKITRYTIYAGFLWNIYYNFKILGEPERNTLASRTWAGKSFQHVTFIRFDRLSSGTELIRFRSERGNSEGIYNLFEHWLVGNEYSTHRGFILRRFGVSPDEYAGIIMREHSKRFILYTSIGL
jgi:hypothetical protein